MVCCVVSMRQRLSDGKIECRLRVERRERHERCSKECAANIPDSRTDCLAWPTQQLWYPADKDKAGFRHQKMKMIKKANRFVASSLEAIVLCTPLRSSRVSLYTKHILFSTSSAEGHERNKEVQRRECFGNRDHCLEYNLGTGVKK